VATPALLPDGSVAPESLSRLIEATASKTLDHERKAVAGTLPEPDARALAPGKEDGS
jgi:NADH-quinone oxidoreductase subunit J